MAIRHSVKELAISEKQCYTVTYMADEIAT